MTTPDPALPARRRRIALPCRLIVLLGSVAAEAGPAPIGSAHGARAATAFHASARGTPAALVPPSFAVGPPAISNARSGESEAFAAALELKQKKLSREAALAFEAYAQTYPSSPRAREARVEAGVSWFALGRSRQVLHRNPPDAVEAFALALRAFEGATKNDPESAEAGRAQYMVGSTRLFLGDPVAAEAAYSLVLERYGKDRKYVAKALEKRSAARRHRLDDEGSVADLVRYKTEFPTGEESAAVEGYLRFAAMNGKPAPALDVESWIQGEPATLESLQGEVVALYFFATWCESCEKEKAFVADLHARFAPLGVRVLGVVDRSQGQTVDSVRAYLALAGLSFPVMMDRGRTTAAYAATRYPNVVLIDRLGRVRWHDHLENLSDATIEILLTEDPSAQQPTPPAPPTKAR